MDYGFLLGMANRLDILFVCILAGLHRLSFRTEMNIPRLNTVQRFETILTPLCRETQNSQKSPTLP